MTNFNARQKQYGTHRNRVRYVGTKTVIFTPGEGDTAYITSFKGRLRPKGIPFSGFSCMKTLGFCWLKNIKGRYKYPEIF